MQNYVIALACVLSLAIGQILFKLSAVQLEQHGSFFAIEVLRPLVAALALYGVSTIAWVWVLQRLALGRAYPLMALAFILVPIGGFFFLGERFHAQYYVGITLIVIGIIFTLRG